MKTLCFCILNINWNFHPSHPPCHHLNSQRQSWSGFSTRGGVMETHFHRPEAKPGNKIPSTYYQFKVRQGSTFQSSLLFHRNTQLLLKEDQFSAQLHHFCYMYNQFTTQVLKSEYTGRSNWNGDGDSLDWKKHCHSTQKMCCQSHCMQQINKVH